MLPVSRVLARISEVHSRAQRMGILWVEQARTALGIRRGVHAPDHSAYFKELSAERLARALSPRGQGLKHYRVTFADGGPKQYIRCARERCYADLMGAEHLSRLERIASIIRPGSRLLEIASAPMLTGYTADYLARMVGESGSVVTLIPDEEGARFAERRYARANLSIEHLDGPACVEQALAGETNNAFHAIVHLGIPDDPPARDALMRELLRVLAPGGWMLAGVRLTNNPKDEAIQSLRAHLMSIGHTISDDAPNSQLMDVLLQKAPHPTAPPAGPSPPPTTPFRSGPPTPPSSRPS
jgi:protein-L-isoaspartate O-methyltransferase